LTIPTSQTLKIVHHSPEFLPYVIFLAASSPACMKQLGCNKKNEADNDFLSSDEEIQSAVEESRRIREEYQQYFDLEIAVDDLENSFRTIMEAVVKLQNESQWVPLNWVYS